jgi:hypothetical protein
MVVILTKRRPPGVMLSRDRRERFGQRFDKRSLRSRLNEVTESTSRFSR